MTDTSLVFNIIAKDKASSVFGKIKGSAIIAGAAIGAALTTGLASAFSQGQAESKLAGQLGSVSLAAEYGKIAGSMYVNNFGASVAENMQSIRDVMSSGLLSEDAENAAIESVTSKVRALADTFDQQVTPLARAAGQMIRNGLVDNADEALDVVTRLFQQTGDHAGDALDTLSEYSVQFRKLGLDGAQSASLLVQGLRAGARDVDTVADAIKEFSIRAVDGSKLSAEGFKALGLDAKKMTQIFAKGGPEAAAGLDTVLDRLRAMKDPVAQQAAAVALFGTKAEDLGASLLALDTGQNALGNIAGAADKLVAATGASPQATLETFKRKAEQALVETAAKAIPYIIDLAKWLQTNKDQILPIVAVLGTLVGIIYTLVTIVKIYTAVQWALNIAMTANPIGLIIAAIVLLVAGIYLLWTNSSGFRDFFIGMWDHIWSFMKMIGNWFAGPFVDFFKNAWAFITNSVEFVKNFVVNSFMYWIDFIGSIPGKIRAFAIGMFDGIVNAFKGMINLLISLWNRLDFGINIRVPDWVPLIGGQGFSVPDLFPDIPYLAKGGISTRAGLAMVGEEGPELVHLDRGATVTPLDRVGGGGGSVVISGDDSRFAEAVLWVVRKAVRNKGGRGSALGIRSVVTVGA